MARQRDMKYTALDSDIFMVVDFGIFKWEGWPCEIKASALLLKE